MGKIPYGFKETAANFLIKSNPSPTSTIPEQIRPPIPRRSPREKPSRNKKPNDDASSPPSPIVFASPKLSDAKSVFNSFISSIRIAPSEPNFYNSILKSFASVSSLPDSILFLNHMVKTHPAFSPNRFTYHTLLERACSSSDETTLTNAHNVLNYMSDNGVPPNKATVDVAARALCGCGREGHAMELVKELCAQEIVPDEYTYNFMVRHFVKNLSMSTVNMFITDMREFGVKPNLVTYTIMIDNVCNSKNLREAARLLRVLSEEGFKPDCYVYNTMMKGYCSLGRGNQVLEVYKNMQDEGVKPDLVTYNTLVFGLSQTGRVKEAMKYLGVMVEMGFSPNEVTYTSLMNGMCREGNALRALGLLKEMEAKGIAPNSCTYNTLLHGLCKANLLDKGFEVYRVMKDGNVKLETGSYGTFLRALCRVGKVAEAYEVFDYAVESKSLTDVTAYSTLDVTLKWLRKAREEGLKV